MLMTQYNNSRKRIPGRQRHTDPVTVISPTSRTKPSGFRRSISQHSTDMLLGNRRAARTSVPATADVVATGGFILGNVASSSIPKLGDKLYVQMTIRTFIEGNEDVIDRLYSDEGPVDDVKKAKSFNTMRAAMDVVKLVRGMRTKEYQVIEASARTPESISVRKQSRRLVA